MKMKDYQVAVRILMKNGQTRNGILLTDHDVNAGNLSAVRFICNTKFNAYLENQNKEYIEELSIHQIKSLDSFLK
jgi:hypothetical protein